ncbi:uncharacterized protein P884DRAFT_195665 [Thermothelomyces heterothallicus CBS 202.75]|uniref:uncharacterized protein n=1 Tax=Thermothelomyces heterothallicus CBS 202.75 TaxID=1149848 RepID=UPI003742ABF4
MTGIRAVSQCRFVRLLLLGIARWASLEPIGDWDPKEEPVSCAQMLLGKTGRQNGVVPSSLNCNGQPRCLSFLLFWKFGHRLFRPIQREQATQGGLLGCNTGFFSPGIPRAPKLGRAGTRRRPLSTSQRSAMRAPQRRSQRRLSSSGGQSGACKARVRLRDYLAGYLSG